MTSRKTAQQNVVLLADALSRRGRPGRQLRSSNVDQKPALSATEAEFLVKLANASMVKNVRCQGNSLLLPQWFQ